MDNKTVVELKTELLMLLVELKAKMSVLPHDELSQVTSGICFNIEWQHGYSFEHGVQLREAFAQWPESSGFAEYPVPGVAGHDCWASYKLARQKKIGMWVGEYGERRWNLLNWTINHLTESLDVQSN